MESQLYLRTLGLLSKFSKIYNTKSYIFGGLTLDIWEGKFLREHDDIDVLCEQMYLHRGMFHDFFSKQGYETKDLENYDFKAIKKEAKIHIGHLEIRDSQVEWKHNGDKGSIIFAKDWLDQKVYHFYDIELFTVKPEFEYVLKTHPELMNPDWVLRQKDLDARERLINLLDDKYGDLDSLYELVASI